MEEEERILIETCSLVSVASTNFLIDPPIRPCVAIAFFFAIAYSPFDLLLSVKSYLCLN